MPIIDGFASIDVCIPRYARNNNNHETTARGGLRCFSFTLKPGLNIHG